MRRRSQEIRIAESSQVGEARRVAQGFATKLGLDESQAGRVSIAITELGTNILKHAREGRLILSIDDHGIDVLALDRGPGMANLSRCLTDGYSTSGTQGTGLGAIARLATRAEFFSSTGMGTVIWARFAVESAEREKRSGLLACGFSVPYPGEPVCGDEWEMGEQGEQVLVAVADGLGHGERAAEAAHEAMRSVSAHQTNAPAAILTAAHGALRSTRGAAMSIAQIDFSSDVVVFAGVGNVSGVILDGDKNRRMVSYDGTLGLQMRKVQEMPYPFPARSLLVMHSDGIATNWDLKNYPGLLAKHPALIAGVLLRDFSRGRDDATVVVVRKEAA